MIACALLFPGAASSGRPTHNALCRRPSSGPFQPSFPYACPHKSVDDIFAGQLRAGEIQAEKSHRKRFGTQEKSRQRNSPCPRETGGGGMSRGATEAFREKSTRLEKLTSKECAAALLFRMLHVKVPEWRKEVHQLLLIKHQGRLGLNVDRVFEAAMAGYVSEKWSLCAPLLTYPAEPLRSRTTHV